MTEPVSDATAGSRPGIQDVFSSVRFRLTIAYSSLLVGLSGLALLAVYVLLARGIEGEPVTQTFQVTRLLRLPDESVVTMGNVEVAAVASIERAVNYSTMETLRVYSLWAMAFLFVTSLFLGWWLSGRALAPVEQMTRTAQQITATDLSRRINLEGPDDELTRLSRTIDDMLERLDDAFTTQRSMVDDASHELRTPLAVIRTNVDVVLSQDDVTPEERAEATVVVERAVDRMARLVEDLLASARSASQAFADRAVDLSDVVRDACDDLRLVAGERQIQLRTESAAGLEVSGDVESLTRALNNLVSNAIRHSFDGGEILVSAGVREGWTYLAVADRGEGIPLDQQAHVFDRFWRADANAARREGRSGLGLAIVRQIAEGHGGRVTLASIPGQGSTFVIWLPRRDVAAATRSKV